MARFHVNNKGNPFPCKARTRCPFGDLETGHYDTKEAAMAAYEEEQKENTLPTGKNKNWSAMTREQLEELEVASMEEKMRTKLPLTNAEYDRHREYIRKVDASEDSTHKRHTTKVKGKTVYSPERQEAHERLVEQFEERYAQVPSDGKVILSGGMPGAGKTTLLEKTYGEELKDYAVVNPDDVKVAMAEAGLAPDIPGLAPLETNSIIHYEATVITEKIYERLSTQRKNLVLDKTMASPGPVKKDIADLRAKGYQKFEAFFVDVDPDVAYDRILTRHRKGFDEYLRTGGKTLGERAVKGTIVSSCRTDDPNFYSKNTETFKALRDEGLFDHTHYTDNNVYE